MDELGAYGKLPWAREFVRAGARLGRPIEALIDDGAPFWMRSGPTRDGDRIALRAGETTTCLTVFPSNDLAGERRHPFALGARLSGTDASTLIGTWATWQSHEAVKRDIDVATDLTTTQAALARAPIRGPSVVAPARTVGVAQWATTAFAGGREALVLALWHLRCFALGAGSARPVRLPLSASHDVAAQLLTWDALCRQAFRGPAAALVLPRDAAALLAFSAPPNAAELCGLLTPERSPLLDLSLEPEPAFVSGYSAFARRCETQLVRDDRLPRIVALLEGA